VYSKNKHSNKIRIHGLRLWSRGPIEHVTRIRLQPRNTIEGSSITIE